MNPRLKKGLIVAALHLAIVGSLGVKLLVDRATRPRVWARTGPIDPDSPLRGRYVRLRVEGEPLDFSDAVTSVLPARHAGALSHVYQRSAVPRDAAGGRPASR